MRFTGRHGTARRRPAAPAWAFLALALAVSALSCGGSSSGSVAPPGACLDFAPGAAPSPGTVVATEGGLTTCDRLALDLVITDVGDVFTAEFKLSFDPDVLRYDGHYESGSVLASDGAPVTVFENEQNGLLQFTITRLGASWDGIDVVGSQFLVRLNFVRELDSGGSPLSFSNERIWNSDLDLIPGVVSARRHGDDPLTEARSPGPPAGRAPRPTDDACASRTPKTYVGRPFSSDWAEKRRKRLD